MKALLTVTAMSAAILVAPAANAAVFEGTWSVSANSGDGLIIETAPSAGVISENLEVGDSTSIFLFNLWTPESDVGSDDQVPKPIEVAFNFTSPPSGGTAGGTTEGESRLFGLVQYGVLSWSNPYTFNFGSGGSGEYTISLTEGAFNEGFFGLNNDPGAGIGVYADLHYTVAAVPLPATAAFALLGVAGFAGYRRVQKKKAA